MVETFIHVGIWLSVHFISVHKKLFVIFILDKGSEEFINSPSFFSLKKISMRTMNEFF